MRRPAAGGGQQSAENFVRKLRSAERRFQPAPIEGAMIETARDAKWFSAEAEKGRRCVIRYAGNAASGEQRER